MKIQAFSTLGEISHFAISGYFVISGFDITGVYCISLPTHINTNILDQLIVSYLEKKRLISLDSSSCQTLCSSRSSARPVTPTQTSSPPQHIQQHKDNHFPSKGVRYHFRGKLKGTRNYSLRPECDHTRSCGVVAWKATGCSQKVCPFCCKKCFCDYFGSNLVLLEFLESFPHW